MKYDQILHGVRQSGKSTWLVEQAYQFVQNRNGTNIVIIVNTPNSRTTKSLIGRINSLINSPTVAILTVEDIDTVNWNQIKYGLVIDDEYDLIKDIETYYDKINKLVEYRPIQWKYISTTTLGKG